MPAAVVSPAHSGVKSTPEAVPALPAVATGPVPAEAAPPVPAVELAAPAVGVLAVPAVGVLAVPAVGVLAVPAVGVLVVPAVGVLAEPLEPPVVGDSLSPEQAAMPILPTATKKMTERRVVRVIAKFLAK
jgi:hypothetical protein